MPNPDPGATILGHAMNGAGGTGGADLSFTVPSGVGLAAGTLVRVQGIHIDTSGNGLFNTTNEAVFEFQAGLIVEAVGANSFNSDITSGYFRVLNFTGLPVTAATFDISTTVAGAPFDTDQAGMLDRFDGGDAAGTGGGCDNTYRNGSDVATGLVTAGTTASPLRRAGPERLGRRRR